MVDADALKRVVGAHRRQNMPALPGRTNHIPAGVLVPLIVEAPLRTVVTVRASHLAQHPGEVCFPGGKPEGDEAAEATALREASEEIDLSDAEVIGRLSSIPLYTSEHRLEPFVALIPQQIFSPSPDEVAEVRILDIEAWLEPDFVDAIEWQMRDRTHLSPVFDLDGVLLFGATAHVFFELLSIVAPLFERTVPERRPGRYAWDFDAGRPIETVDTRSVQASDTR